MAAILGAGGVVATGITVAEGMELAAGVVEGIARGVAALQQLQAANTAALAAGQTDIPFTAVQAARDWMLGQRAALAKDLGIDPGTPGAIVDPQATIVPVVQVPPPGEGGQA